MFAEKHVVIYINMVLLELRIKIGEESIHAKRDIVRIVYNGNNWNAGFSR